MQLYAGYETHSRFTNTHKLKVKGYKKYPMQMVPKREQEWLHLYHTKQTLVKNHHKRQRSILNNGKRGNSAGWYNEYKYNASNIRVPEYRVGQK